MNASAKAPQTSRLGRSLVAGGAAVRVGARSVQHRLRGDVSPEAAAAHEAEIGRVIFAALSQLRGTALKAAQVLSLDEQLLPPGVRAQLARATHQAVPLNRALVSRAFRSAFGQEPGALFAHFEPEAFAAASLGQVHRARLADGRDVAVKVQYPGIAETIDSDLRLLRQALRLLGRERLALPDDALIDRLLAEVRRQLDEEVDYRHEAQAQAWFTRHTLREGLHAPSVIDSHSGATVLTQSFETGDHLDAWLARAPAQALRDRQAQTVFDWAVDCAFGHHHIHADLHPGNFLFRPDGTVVVLDFGCTKQLSPGVMQPMASAWHLWLTAGAAAAAEILAAYQRMGMTRLELDEATFRREVLPIIAPMLDWATEPFGAERFDFATKSRLPGPLPAAQRQVLSRWLGEVPPEVMSLDRAWLALMHLLGRLGGRVDTRAARARLQACAQAPAC